MFTFQLDGPRLAVVLTAIGSPRGRPSDFPAGGHRFSPQVAIGSPHALSCR